jgi:hypothetical protein
VRERLRVNAAPETAVALLAIVFPDMDAVPHISQFSLFLSTKPGLKRVTLDEASAPVLMCGFLKCNSGRVMAL